MEESPAPRVGQSNLHDSDNARPLAGANWPVGLSWPAALFIAFLSLGLWIYGPSSEGPFISDDIHYVRDNPYVTAFDKEALFEILDPYSPVVVHVENYAPVHLLGHVAAWAAFGKQTYGHHLVNVVLHALACVLIALLFVRSGISKTGAALGGLLLLCHPANVEAVAWISQLKSSLALVLIAGALLAHPRLPATGAMLFALSMLAKPMAWLALPVVATAGWLQRSTSHDGNHQRDWRWRWLGLWAATFLAYSAIELTAYSNWVMPSEADYADAWTAFRSFVVVAGNYLVLAATGIGSSSFRDAPAAATSWADARWLASAGALAVLGWRVVISARERRAEFVWWIWAGAAYGPFSGLIPLPHVMADRYLYFVLPGLAGAALHVVEGLAASNLPEPTTGINETQDRETARPIRRAAQFFAIAAILVLCAGHTTRARERAAIWTSEANVMNDAIRNYPDGKVARQTDKVDSLRRAESAAKAGDNSKAIRILRDLHGRGFDAIDLLLFFPAFVPLIPDADYRTLLQEIGAGIIEKYGRRAEQSQYHLQQIGLAYFVHGEIDAAERHLERGLEIGGPADAAIRTYLLTVRAQRFGSDSGSGARPSSN